MPSCQTCAPRTMTSAIADLASVTFWPSFTLFSIGAGTKWPFGCKTCSFCWTISSTRTHISSWNLSSLWQRVESSPQSTVSDTPPQVAVDSRWKWTLWLRTFSKSETKCNMRSQPFQWLNPLLIDQLTWQFPVFDGPSDLSQEIVGAIVDSLAECYGYPFLTGWLRAEVFYTHLAGQELYLLHVDRPAEGYSSSHSTDRPRTVLSPIHINKLS